MKQEIVYKEYKSGPLEGLNFSFQKQSSEPRPIGTSWMKITKKGLASYEVIGWAEAGT